MPAAGSCRVCSHPERERIEQLIAAGTSVRGVAREVGLPEATIRTHRSRCRKAAAKAARVAVAAAPPPADLVLPDVVLPPDDPQAALLAELRYVHGRALEAYERAVAAKDDRTIALLVQQLRNNLKAQSDIIAKARKDERPPAERLAQNPEWVAYQGVLLAALDRHAEAKADVLAALERFVAEEAMAS